MLKSAEIELQMEDLRKQLVQVLFEEFVNEHPDLVREVDEAMPKIRDKILRELPYHISNPKDSLFLAFGLVPGRVIPGGLSAVKIHQEE